MTERDAPPAPRAPVEPDPNSHLDHAPRGDGPPMSLMLATRPQSRPPTTDSQPVDPVRACLARLFAADPDLPAFDPAELPPAADRPAPEAHAAARAAACPDLFVVHAPDPAAGERVIADAARACGLNGHGRVLVLSPNPVAADRITERIARGADVTVVRALADDENPARPSPLVAKVTSAALGAARVEQLKRDAADAVAAADAKVSSFASAAAAFDLAAGLTARAAALDAELADLAARRDRVEAEVRSETDTPFAARVAGQKAVHDQTAAGFAAEREAAVAARAEKEAAAAALRRQHAEAVGEAAKKSGFFSRLLGGKSKPGSDPADLEKQAHALDAEAAALAARAAELQQRAAAETAAFLAESEALVRAEVEARRAELDARHDALAADRERLRGEIDAAVRPLGPTPPTANELAAARDDAARDAAAARERADELGRTAADLVRRFLAEPRVVVGTPGSLPADPVFDPTPRGPGTGPAFGLLVLDRAEELHEHEFAHLAKLASRWVLVGDAPAEEPRPVNGSYPRHGRNGRPADAPFAARLARILDRETWTHEGDRLVCRLAHPTPDQRRGMTREPLLDRPEIEVRFTTDAGGEPRLSEVAFPAGTTVAAAKRFVFRELGEVLLRPCGPVRWHHGADALAAYWAAADQADGEWVDLEPGVREKVVGSGPCAFTAAVTFDPSAGWDTASAGEWLAARTPAASTGRFAAVPRAAVGPPRLG